MNNIKGFDVIEEEAEGSEKADILFPFFSKGRKWGKNYIPLPAFPT